MPHQDIFLNGKRLPTVTEITGIVDKSMWLVPWASKHGTLKTKALADYVVGKSAGEDQGVGCIPDSWFEANNLKRADFWKSCDELTKEAQERGIHRHEQIEKALKDNTTPEDPLVQGVVDWAHAVGFKPVVFEFKVTSEKHMYGGTFDCAGYIDKTLVLVDWKFTGRLEKSYRMQAAAYAAAFEEQAHEIVDELRIIRPYELQKKAKKNDIKATTNGVKYSFEGKDVYVEEQTFKGIDREEAMQGFLAARSLFKYLKGD